MTQNNKNYPIDAVITWVDGNAPEHRKKRAKYAAGGELKDDAIGGAVRFESVGEIFFCVASILRFAPFIRKIYIVTDGQNPCLDGFVNKHFPDRTTEIEIVDHKSVFNGYEALLPVFNSLSIESMLWRIPGLSERYVYFNDDVMLAAPVTPEDFFSDGRIVCRAERFSMFYGKILKDLRLLKFGRKVFGFKDAMMNAVKALGGGKEFIYFDHTPHPQMVSIFKEYYSEHEDTLLKNACPRFREFHQYNPQELNYLLADRKGKCLILPKKGALLYLHPKGKPNYIRRKINYFNAHPEIKFCCLNSLSNAKPEDIVLAKEWLMNRIGI